MTPDECIELLATPYGITPTDHSFVLESAGRKARITVDSNSGSIHGLRVTLYGRSFPQLELTREGGFERLGKQLRIAREAQLGEAIFDAKIYVDTTLTEPQVRQVLGTGATRGAVLELFRHADKLELQAEGAVATALNAEGFANDSARLPPLLEKLATLVDSIPDVSGLVAGQRVRYTPGCGLVTSWVLAFAVLCIAVSVVLPSARLLHTALLTMLGFALSLVAALLVTLLVALVRSGGSRSFRETLVAGGAITLLLLPAGPLTLALLNQDLDRSTPVTHSLEIVNAELQEDDNGVHLELEFRSPFDATDTVRETFVTDHVPRAGTRVTVTTRSGGLGFPYHTEAYFTE